MANFKEINWKEIQECYVMSNDFPSYDELTRRFGVSKPIIMAFANNRNELLNDGKTWIELRAIFREGKANKSDSEESTEKKLQAKKSVKQMRSIQDCMYELIVEDLSHLLEIQQEARANGQRFDISKHVRVSDFIKLAEAIDNTGKAKQTQSAPISLTFEGSEPKKLEDMTDDELKRLEFKVNTETGE